MLGARIDPAALCNIGEDPTKLVQREDWIVDYMYTQPPDMWRFCHTKRLEASLWAVPGSYIITVLCIEFPTAS